MDHARGHTPATAPHETLDKEVAFKTSVTTGKLPTLGRRFGTVVYTFPAGTAVGGKSLDFLYGAAPIPANTSGFVLEQTREKFAATEARYHSEEHRRQRQGANAAEAPSYSRAELERMTSADQQIEMPSVHEAMAARRVAGFTYEPERAPKPMLFTKSQLRSMHPDDEMAIHDQVMAAIKNGQVDYSK